MSSFISKINLGINSKRSKCNLTSNNSSTTNIGKIQPTFCREMIPGSTFKMNSVNSFVRLAPLSVPTFAPMEFRHYHAFVPYNSLYFPFDSFLANQNYTNSNGITFLPDHVPYFNLNNIFQYFAISRGTYQVESFCMFYNIYNVRTESYVRFDSLSLSQIKALHFFNSTPFNVESGLFLAVHNDEENTQATCKACNLSNGSWSDYNDVEALTLDNADFVLRNGSDDFVILIRLNTNFKELRKIFIGLGCQFSPCLTDTNINLMRFLAFYKAWYQLFVPQRDSNFFSTNCYKLISNISNSNGTLIHSRQESWSLLIAFFKDLMRMCYYLPTDYFSMSTTSTNPIGNITLESIRTISDTEDTLTSVTDTDGGPYTENPDYSLAQNMAQRILRFVNKNTVIGRNIRDYLKTTFGVVDEHDLIHEEVHFIGSSSINLDVNDIFANSDTYNESTEQGAQLGEYAGIGLGHGSSQSFEYTAKEFGVWITFSVVIPKGGYTQGTLRECENVERLDFFTPEFDALGYQTLNNSELISDFDIYSESNSGVTGAFGLVPRYSNYKVGFNRLNGDLSLRSRRDMMGKYTLDRYLYDPLADWESIEMKLSRFQNVPSVFRAIGLDERYGNYNRIFNYTKDDEDHFILHMVFNLDAIIPGKSLADSYDTDETYDRTIGMAKQ